MHACVNNFSFHVHQVRRAVDRDNAEFDAECQQMRSRQSYAAVRHSDSLMLETKGYSVAKTNEGADYVDPDYE